MHGVLVVTGGSRGIGRAIALSAAANGYAVCFSYVAHADAAAGLVDQIVRAGGQAQAVKSDAGNAADIIGLFAAADRMGKLTALVNNAGIVDYPRRVEEFTAERLERIFRINTVGTILCAGQAVRRMSKRRGGAGGSIVNISSAAARHGGAGEYTDYAASKGAIDTFTVGLAKEVASEGIRVNAVRPGIIDTEIHASGGQPDRVARLRSMIPMQREGSAGEVAEAVIWLLSDAASYTTGAILDVSGGR